MPNGGSDNCLFCRFNRLNKENFDKAHDLFFQRVPESADPADYISFCTIRNLPIDKPLATYCLNQRPGGDYFPHGKDFSTTPCDAVYTLGTNGYERIPWNGANAPRIYVPGTCLVCGIKFEDGIEVDTDTGVPAQFCCNDHYLAWWKEKHPGE